MNKKKKMKDRLLRDDDDDEYKTTFQKIFSKRNIIIGIIFALFTLVILLLTFLTNFHLHLEDEVKVINIMKHLENFYEIAKENSNSRSIKYGFVQSAEYVINTLKNFSDCNVTYSPFFFPNIMFPLKNQVMDPII